MREKILMKKIKKREKVKKELANKHGKSLKINDVGNGKKINKQSKYFI